MSTSGMVPEAEVQAAVIAAVAEVAGGLGYNRYEIEGLV